jgi:hypothetical protein
MESSKSGSSIRIGGIAGIVFAVGMIVLGFLVWFDQPLYTDSIGEIREHFADKETTINVANWLAALFFVGGLLLFASALRAVLGRDEGGDGVWSRASFAGAVASVGVAGSGVFLSTFTVGGMEALSDGVVQAFVRADMLIYSTILPWGLALFLVGASVVMVRGRSFPTWLGWLGLAASAVMAVGALWPIDGDPEGALAIVGMVGMLAGFVWILLGGALLARK